MVKKGVKNSNGEPWFKYNISILPTSRSSPEAAFRSYLVCGKRNDEF
jgi:hypothetical protein